MHSLGTARASKSDPKSVLVVGHQPGTESGPASILSLIYPRSVIEVVPSAEEAYLRLVRGGIDLVICEEDLPQGHKGLALWKLMQTRGPSLPFILLSEKFREQAPVVAPGKIAPTLLVKPISAEALQGSVSEAMLAQTAKPRPAPGKIEVLATKISVTISFFSTDSPGRDPITIGAFSFHPLARGPNDLFAEQALEVGQSVSVIGADGATVQGKVLASRRAPTGRTLQAKPFPFAVKIEIA
jgi:CheY-like chemotaxis protein